MGVEENLRRFRANDGSVMFVGLHCGSWGLHGACTRLVPVFDEKARRCSDSGVARAPWSLFSARESTFGHGQRPDIAPGSRTSERAKMVLWAGRARRSAAVQRRAECQETGAKRHDDPCH